MFRNYDWQCKKCRTVRSEIVEFPQGERPPKSTSLHCAWCDEPTTHERMLALPAPYMGEKNFAPMVSGGAYDTVGNKKLPPLPVAKAWRDVAFDSDGKPLSRNYTPNERKEMKDALIEHHHSKELKEAKAERAKVQKENAAKKKRAAAIRRGENVNLRRDKLPGDPKILS